MRRPSYLDRGRRRQKCPVVSGRTDFLGVLEDPTKQNTDPFPRPSLSTLSGEVSVTPTPPDSLRPVSELPVVLNLVFTQGRFLDLSVSTSECPLRMGSGRGPDRHVYGRRTLLPFFSLVPYPQRERLLDLVYDLQSSRPKNHQRRCSNDTSEPFR